MEIFRSGTLKDWDLMVVLQNASSPLSHFTTMFKTQASFKESLGKPKDNGGDENKSTRGNFSLWRPELEQAVN